MIQVIEPWLLYMCIYVLLKVEAVTDLGWGCDFLYSIW